MVERITPRLESLGYVTVVFERSARDYAGYVPDLHGFIATGMSRAVEERSIREAIAFHVDRLQAEGEQVPQPSAWTELVEA